MLCGACSVAERLQEQIDVGVEREVCGAMARTLPQPCVRLRILEARHNRTGEAVNRGRISWRQMSVLPRREPLADAADRKRGDRQTMTRRLEADQRERLGPEAGQNH